MAYRAAIIISHGHSASPKFALHDKVFA